MKKAQKKIKGNPGRRVSQSTKKKSNKQTTKPKITDAKIKTKGASWKQAETANSKELFFGTFAGNDRGFGFISVSDKREEDIFIPPNLTGGAIHGDEVEYRVVKTEGGENDTHLNGDPRPLRKIGQIVKITHRRAMVGTFFMDGNNGFVRSVSQKIPYIFAVPPKTRKRFGLVEGHRVIFSVDKTLSPDVAHCFVTEVIGHINDPGVDVLSLVYEHSLPYEFPEEVTTAAAQMPDEVLSTEIRGRRDLRNMEIFTVDGEDTKDIDDALSLEFLPNGGFLLGVHIADVTHYVRENSALDHEALRRGTSVYLADRVIPMLPHSLSSGICSLFPDVDRLTVSCFMRLDSQGNVQEYEFAESVIHSKKRWTYDEVDELLDDGENSENALHLQSDETDAYTTFAALDRLREKLFAKRTKRGALDFDRAEVKIKVDESGFPIDLIPRYRTRATGIIEECMILCNETIAAHFFKHETPFIYRTHDKPEEEKINRLAEITKPLGFRIGKDELALQKLLTASHNTPAAYIVSQALLRSLPQARYTAHTPTHFGLASTAYTHFTSPIRRYADLQIHRIIKTALQGKDTTRFEAIIEKIASQSSRTERAAEALEREVTQLKKVQYMQGKEGQIYEAIISGITKWGAYTMLPNTVEGLIPVGFLKDAGYTFDREKMLFESRKRTLRPGDKIKVRLVFASPEEMRLVFALI